MDRIVDGSNETTLHKKPRRGRAYWQMQVEAWEHSEQTQQSFCKDHGLCYRQLSHWKNRFKLERLSESEPIEAQFVPIKLTSPVSTAVTPGVQIYLPNGVRIELSSEQHLPLLLCSAKALMALSC